MLDGVRARDQREDEPGEVHGRIQDDHDVGHGPRLRGLLGHRARAQDPVQRLPAARHRIRRPDQDERERVRKEAEQAKKDEEEERKRLEKVAEFERNVEERRQKVNAWAEARGINTGQGQR